MWLIFAIIVEFHGKFKSSESINYAKKRATTIILYDKFKMYENKNFELTTCVYRYICCYYYVTCISSGWI